MRAGKERERPRCLPGRRHHLRRRPPCWLSSARRRRPRIETLVGARSPTPRFEFGRIQPQRVNLVQPGRQPLGQPSRVCENDRRPVLENPVDDVFFDVWPDRTLPAGRTHRVPGCRPRGRGCGAELSHVLDRDHDRQVELLRGVRRDYRNRSPAGEKPRDFFARTHRRRESDPLGWLFEQKVEPLEREREVRTPLGRGDRVHLVDNDRLDAREGLPCGGGEHEVQGLRGGDEDIRRMALQQPAIRGGRVSRPHPDGDLGWLHPEPSCRLGDPDERGTQVALDIDGERLERRDVEHPGAPVGVFRGRHRGEPVDRPEKRSQRLAGSGGRDDEGVRAAGDRLPCSELCGSGCCERASEPLSSGGGESVEHCAHPTIFPRTTDSAARAVPAHSARSGG